MHPPKDPFASQTFTSPAAIGFLIYSNDGFMLSLIHEPDGSNVHSYGGPVTMEQDAESGRIVVSHHVKANVEGQRNGGVQRRVPTFAVEDGVEVLNITTDGVVEVSPGEERIVLVKWKRAREVYGMG